MAGSSHLTEEVIKAIKIIESEDKMQQETNEQPNEQIERVLKEVLKVKNQKDENAINAAIEILDKCKERLKKKSEEYACTSDYFIAFREAARLQKIDMDEALMGMMAKHTVSIYALAGTRDIHDLDHWEEKLGDSICYEAILYAMRKTGQNGEA